MSSHADNSGEFDLIKNLFAPLSAGFDGAFGLGDDAAVFSVSAGHELVVTKDAMVAGVHFLENDTADNIARKLLRTNLSDIAAMGAVPRCYLLSIALNDKCDAAWLKKFAKGLKDDQSEFNISLIGGDTVSTNGPLTLSVTMMGEVPHGKSLRRNGAKVGDLLCVSGTIGDAALGLLVATGILEDLTLDHAEYLKGRYFIPNPRVNLGSKLTNTAMACLDISDGLLADTSHLCAQSEVGAEIDLHSIPLSDAARNIVLKDPSMWEKIVAGGDDYELVFTVPKSERRKIEVMARECDLPLTVIGRMIDGSSINVFDQNREIMTFKSKGWKHR